MAHVLVTGSAGRLGRAAVAALLSRGHTVVGYDLVPTPGLPRDLGVVAGLHDVAALRAAARGADAVIHLAATPDDATFPREGDEPDNFLSELLPNNVAGVYRVFEVVRQLQIPRLIAASTGQVIDRHLDAGTVPVTADTPFAPRYLYAATKVFLEGLGKAYAAQHGIDVLAVRLGWCPRDLGQVAQIRASAEDQDVYLSPGDAGRFFAAAVEANPWGGFRVLYATSRPLATTLYDLGDAEKLLGWTPRDVWPTGSDTF